MHVKVRFPAELADPVGTQHAFGAYAFWQAPAYRGRFRSAPRRPISALMQYRKHRDALAMTEAMCSHLIVTPDTEVSAPQFYRFWRGDFLPLGKLLNVISVFEVFAREKLGTSFLDEDELVISPSVFAVVRDRHKQALFEWRARAATRPVVQDIRDGYPVMIEIIRDLNVNDELFFPLSSRTQLREKRPAKYQLW